MNFLELTAEDSLETVFINFNHVITVIERKDTGFGKKSESEIRCMDGNIYQVLESINEIRDKISKVSEIL